MKLGKKKSQPAPAKRPEPTLEDKLGIELRDKANADALLATAVRALDASSLRLGDLRDEIEDEITRLAGLSDMANRGAVSTLVKADAVRAQA